MHERPRTCIFCGGRPLTKEHIFPDWLKKHLPVIEERTKSEINDVKFGIAVPKILSSKLGKLNRPGDPSSQGLRIVCATCNNTWMSQLQSKAKPVLLPLILGEWHPLSENDRETLAAWLTMFVIVAQFVGLDAVAIDGPERVRFFERKKADPSWFISIARYAGDDFLTECSIASLGRVTTENSPIEPLRGVVAESHNGVIGIGKVVFHTFSSSNLRLLRFMSAHYSVKTRLSPIWPIYGGTLSKPPVAIPLNGIDALISFPSYMMKNLRDPWFR